jgi:glycosyltransferase involved in cell wall biosynthesis
MMKQVSPQTGDVMPLVSVVIPTCNRRAVLERCLEALANQTYSNYEVIVVDDGSSDDTPQFLVRFVAEHPDVQVRCLRNEPNSGANPSRNRGIRESKGVLVAFEDDDCIAQPDWLERLVCAFSSNKVAAVVGLVISPKPTNIFELALKGTQRVPGPGPANRLVGCNMCVRRTHLIEFFLDEDRATQARNPNGSVDMRVSGRGDEEGLYLMLCAAGYEIQTVPDAIVLHEHYYTGRSMFRQALRGGRSAARLVYKFYLPTRLDLLPFILSYSTMPLIFVYQWLVIIPAFFFAAALAAITYNDLYRKGKTISETIRSFHVLLAYYHVRLFGYVMEAVRLRMLKNNISRLRLQSA